jgi:hypothetical protein
MTEFNCRLATCLVLAAGLAGCAASDKGGDAGGPTASDALQQVANMIRDYTSANGRPPAKFADLAQFQNLYNVGYKAVESGEVVVVWGAPVAGEGGGGGKGVVAYEKSAGDSGGSVLLQDGTVKKMTAEEFKAAPKAK